MSVKKQRTFTGRGAGVSIETVGPAGLERLFAGSKQIAFSGGGLNYSESSLLRGGRTVRVNGAETEVRLTGEEVEVIASGGCSLLEAELVAARNGRHLPVLPGRLGVTVGGAIAHDIHGKNHLKRGSFATHVNWLELLTPTGPVFASREKNPDVFRASVAGCGLTGWIVRAGLRTVAGRAEIARTQTVKTEGLKETLEILYGAKEEHRYAAMLLDGVRIRALIKLADMEEKEQTGNARIEGRRESRGITVPGWAGGYDCSAEGIRVLERMRFRMSREGSSGQPAQRYLAPLGGVANWNTLIGREGFVQQQCSLPERDAEEALKEILDVLATSGAGSHFMTLRLLGGEGIGALSCGLTGVSLTFDTVYRGEETQNLCVALDTITKEAGGRVHLAKNAFTTPELLAGMFGELGEWRETRSRLDPEGLISSELSRRLQL